MTTTLPMRSPLPDGAQLHAGDYTIEACLGLGGFGITYRALDTTLDRLVAIKEFFPDQCVRHGGTVQPTGGWTAEQFAHFRKRFTEEGKALAKLSHSGIVTVHSVFEEHGTAYLVMAFVDGLTLDAYQHQCGGPLSVEEALRITKAVGEALQAVHAQGLLHRDVKPQNILRRTSGEVVLIDFGAARDFSSDSAHSQTAIYTPGYAPLEQYSRLGNRGSHTDVYALAATCYNLLTGQPPVDAISRAAGVELPTPASLRTDLTPHMSRALLQALALKPEERTTTIEMFLQALAPSVAATAPPAEQAVGPPNYLPFTRVEPVHLVISAGASLTNPKDGAEMIWIPPGEFLMGSTVEDKNADDCQKPQHRVFLDGFWIYKYEVTVTQYRKFCKATGRQMPQAPQWGWGWGWRATHPIVNVTWDDAAAYAHWADATLPTEAQWEKAARGTDERAYPWGNEWDTGKVQCSKKQVADAKKPAPVGSYLAGASPYGCLDMAGNVCEWCMDWYDGEYYQFAAPRNPTGPAMGTNHVVRGGSWDLPIMLCFRCAFRASSVSGGSGVGFRCASHFPGRLHP